MKCSPLWPTYLETGSPHRAATATLQLWMSGILVGMRFKHNIVVDGDYGPETERCVKLLQQQCECLEADGKCGPLTRKAFAAKWGIDFDAIPIDLFVPATEPTTVDPPLSRVYN